MSDGRPDVWINLPPLKDETEAELLRHAGDARLLSEREIRELERETGHRL